MGSTLIPHSFKEIGCFRIDRRSRVYGNRALDPSSSSAEPQEKKLHESGEKSRRYIDHFFDLQAVITFGTSFAFQKSAEVGTIHATKDFQARSPA